MEKIADPLIDGKGRVYSLAGLKRLLRAVTNDGEAVILDGTAKSNDEGFAMHCKYGEADDFEGRTPCGTPRKSDNFALLQGARRRVGSFGGAVKYGEVQPLKRKQYCGKI